MILSSGERGIRTPKKERSEEVYRRGRPTVLNNVPPSPKDFHGFIFSGPEELRISVLFAHNEGDIRQVSFLGVPVGLSYIPLEMFLHY